MSRDFIIGIDCKVYWKDGARLATFEADRVNMIEICHVQDVTLSLSSSMSDITTRCDGSWRAMAPILKDATPTITALWTPDNSTGLKKLWDSYFLGESVPLGFIDGDKDTTTGFVTGIYADFYVSDWSRSESIEEPVTVDIDLQLAKGSFPPDNVWYDPTP